MEEVLKKSVNEKIRFCGLNKELVSVKFCEACKKEWDCEDGNCKYEEDVEHDDWHIEEVQHYKSEV